MHNDQTQNFQQTMLIFSIINLFKKYVLKNFLPSKQYSLLCFYPYLLVLTGCPKPKANYSRRRKPSILKNWRDSYFDWLRPSLFIFGIVFFLTTFMDVVKTITAFKLGHSITLITATLIGVTVDYYLIDAVIALSVCDIGYENIGGFRKLFKKLPNLIWAVFIFGLIHGLGLSTRLQQLPLGEEGILLRIFSFNFGIELGQVVALCLIIALLFRLLNKQLFLQISIISNNGLFLIGAFLFLMQMHGYSHTIGPDEFGFPKDSHFHAHEEMESKTHMLGSEYRTPSYSESLKSK